MENLGYSKPLYILPFDHRSTFAQKMFNKSSLNDLSEEEKQMIKDFKMIIYEGFKKAVTGGIPKEYAAILVDEEFGEAVLTDAKQNGFITILTTEKSGQEEFDFEYGDDFAAHIEKHSPIFAKVLIRYNPEDPEDLRHRQLERLKKISVFCRENGFKFLLEVLVIANEKQKEETDNSKEKFDDLLRPALTVADIKELQDFGIEPDIWKLEGFDTAQHYKEIVETAKENGRENVSLVVLGRGEGEEKVEEWLRIGSKVNGVVGFAVGRTVFWQSLVDFKNRIKTREEAVYTISANFTNFYRIFTS